MPPDEQATRSAARCSNHPGNTSVGVCHACGRPLCITCAVPVRGEVFGPECLPQVLGPDARPAQAVPPRRRDSAFALVGLGFAGAAGAGILPWTRFGGASGILGAWGIVAPRWSTLAALSALVGFLLWIRLRLNGRVGGRGAIALFVLAATSIAGSVLHVLNPPPFTHAWLGPWVALPCAAIAAGAAVWVLARSPRVANADIP